MHPHRFAHQEVFAPLPAVTVSARSPEAFLVCPVVLSQGSAGQLCPWGPIYQLAYERAQAVLRSSWLERFRAVSWN